jgi:hypothetical protein
MPRFFFNIVSERGLVEDLEGTELDDLEQARREAIEDARLLMSQSILMGDDVSSRSIHIVGEGGTVLLALPFTEAFKTLK